MPPPEPVVTTKGLPVPVSVKCEDKRAPPPIYPDTDEAIAAVADDDVFGLAKLYRAGRGLRIDRLKADDAQISACAQ